MRLRDKISIVTGGGSGIGRSIALKFAKEGAKVVVTDWATEGGEKTARMITDTGGEALYIKADVSRAEDVQAMTQTAIQAWRQIDILVNNAAVIRLGSVIETSEDDWNLVLDVNLKGVYLCSREVIQNMIAKGGGAIVNIASVGGLVGPERHAAYGSAKAAVINLTRQMAVDFGPKGVRVNSICPGTIPTPMHSVYYSPEEEEAKLAEWAKLSPLRRVGRPEDIAYAALFLASDEARFVTGANLVVDGGSMAGG